MQSLYCTLAELRTEMILKYTSDEKCKPVRLRCCQVVTLSGLNLKYQGRDWRHESHLISPPHQFKCCEQPTPQDSAYVLW